MTCGSAKCEREAVATVYWPGRDPLAMCGPCAGRARAVGEAMGCTIPTTPITPAVIVVVLPGGGSAGPERE